MLIDKTTEAIAHFIGLFDMTLEQARLRKAYDEFKALERYEEELEALATYKVSIKAGYDFVGYNPELPYTPVAHGIAPATPPFDPGYYAPYIPVYVPPGSVHIGSHTSAGGAAPGSKIAMPPIEPPGSIAVYVEQRIGLADSDYMGVGGHGFHFNATVNDGADLAALMEAAAALQPLDELGQTVPGSTDEIMTFVDDAAGILREYEPDADGEAEITVVREAAIQGKFINGEEVDEIPDIEDYLPDDDREEEEEEEEEPGDDIEFGGNDGDSPPDTVNSTSGGHAEGSGDIEIEVSVELEAGENTLVNEVVITNNTTTCHVMAVVGDHVELNVVVQVNVYCDIDSVTSAIGGWGSDGPDVTQAFNIAEFDRIDPMADQPTPTGGFPQAWVVTEITGDLIIANWVEQYTFMTDNDIAVLASSGVKTVVTAGENTAVNGLSLLELDHHYDLIIVGGCVYDANMILQTNILIDNDIIGAVDGFQTTGEGSVATQGNLLWNQAQIVNYGASDRFEAMPEDYARAAASLAEGKEKLGGVLDDPAFAGMGGLRVLYISGDFVNLTYVKQTTVLGDSDQVALAMNAMAAHPDAAWTLETGANALINIAGIVDVDVMAKTYVGGEIYSDEILIQAELISSAPDLGGQDPDVLVNEAIVFLDDEISAAALSPDGNAIGPIAPNTAYSDPMQNVLA